MHNNEFEKRVEHKLEELKFTPSDAVWQKVEVQIREQKRRRRFFFWWLPAIVLCTGVGAWFIYSIENGNRETSAIKITTQKTESTSSPEGNLNNRIEAVPENKTVAEEKSIQPVVEKNSQREQETAIVIKTGKNTQAVDQIKVNDNRIVTGKKKDQVILKEEKACRCRNKESGCSESC